MLSARFLIIAGLLACLATPAVRAQENKHAAQEQGHAHAPRTMEMSNADIFNHQFSHSVPYAIFEPGIGPRYDGNGIVVDGHEQKVSWLTIYNVQPWQWVCLGLMFAIFLPVLGSFRSGRANRFTRVMRGFCHWVRDEMVYSVMGKEEGRAFVPLFMFTFFFITFQNSIGLLPSAGHTFPFAIYTATGTPFVTVSLAAVTLSLMLVLGMKKNGVFGFWKGLVPHGVPLVLVPLMFVIEFVSLCVKPFALTVRLFANMLSGHLVIAAAIGLIFLFAKMQAGAITSYLTALPCLGLAIFIYIIEAFVTLLQAYIFTFLSINFIYQSMHQDH
ncbi:MAG TPA: F0F1 ATP synthase subunit A [Planctomycetota bacterium]|nr:F0F1 ATP synthase subunit A [Planctomycetota bacterium]